MNDPVITLEIEPNTPGYSAGVWLACQNVGIIWASACSWVYNAVVWWLGRGDDDVRALVFIMNSISFLFLATHPRCVTLCIVDFRLLDTSIIHLQQAPFLSSVSSVLPHPLPKILYTFTPTPFATPLSCRLKTHMKINCTT